MEAPKLKHVTVYLPFVFYLMERPNPVSPVMRGMTYAKGGPSRFYKLIGAAQSPHLELRNAKNEAI